MRIINFEQLKTSGLIFRQQGRLFAILMIMLFLSACAATPTAKETIEQRAQARWDALLARDYETAYSFYSPGFRSATTPVDFEIAQRVRRVTWTGAEVQESSCSGDVCTVDTLTYYLVVRPVPGMTKWENKRITPEKWVRIDGQWWFVPSD